MKISSYLLETESFRQQLEANLKTIEDNIENGTLWNCGLTSKGITIVRKTDKLIDKVAFLVKKFFGFIDTSHASMQELKQRIKVAELNNLTDKVAKAQRSLSDINQKNLAASQDIGTKESVLRAKEEDLRQKNTQIKNSTEELSTLTANINTKRGEVSQLDREIDAKRRELQALQEKINVIAREDVLEAQLQAKRAAIQTITNEINEIANGLGTAHAALIARIGQTELGIPGWIDNANKMIIKIEKSLNEHLSKDKYIKPLTNLEVVINQFRGKLVDLSEDIALIKNVQQYTNFVSELHVIETTGWSYVYYDKTYTIGPRQQSELQKTILRELTQLAELTFTRKQIMALR